jgi:glycosyltransferase involved in cell wall biosynthesis
VSSPQSIAVFLESFLPPSEAFVMAQADALREFQPQFFAFKRQRSHLTGLDKFPVHCFQDSYQGRTGEWLLKGPRIATLPITRAFHGIKLIHAHFGKNGFIAGPLARRLRLPLITTFHGFDATYAGNPRDPGGINQTRFFAYGREKMAGSGWFIAVSNFIRQRLLALGFPDERVFQHYIGTDVDQFSPQPGIRRQKNRIVCVSRFVAYKGHSYIIQALEKVVQSGRDVELCLVGSGPLRGEIEAQARAVLPKVEIFDQLSQAQVRDLVASARVYIHGSITLPNGHCEALGVCNLEAQGVGTPVVAFDSGGVAEAVKSGAGGLVVPERDTAAMAQAVTQLLDDDALWEQRSAGAVRFVRERFDIRNQTKALEAFYHHVLKEARGGDA